MGEGQGTGGGGGWTVRCSSASRVRLTTFSNITKSAFALGLLATD